MDDFTRHYEMCAYCPKLCRHVCPVSNAEARESVTPQAKMMMGNLVQRHLVGCKGDYASVFFHCVGCGHCTEFCNHNVPVSGALFAARAEAVRLNAAPEALDRYVEKFYERNQDLMQRLHRLVASHYFVEEAQVAYMPGCDLIEHTPEDVGGTLRVLEAAGVDYMALMDTDLVCGGYPLWSAGYPAEFLHLAQNLAEVMKGYKKIVCACPACVYLIKNIYPAMGVEVTAEVTHITEFLDTVAHRINVKKTFDSAFYHDPCYLGRFMGVYDPPRRLMGRAVKNIREFSKNKENGVCCGGGGAMPVTVPDAAATMASRRLEEVYETGVSMVVTACSSCVHSLKKAAPSLEVLDIVALLDLALNPER